MSTLHVQTKFYSWLTLTWHLRFPSSTLTAGVQQWIRVGGELFTRPLLPSPLSPCPYRKGLRTKLHDLYFDLDCWLFLAQGAQQTVLQLFLRYLVEIYKCTNASELIRPGIHTRFFYHLWQVGSAKWCYQCHQSNLYNETQSCCPRMESIKNFSSYVYMYRSRP